MSKLICSSAIAGAIAWVAKAEGVLAMAIADKGETAAVAFPNTAYYLPVIYSFTGEKVQTLADCRRVLKRAKELLPERPSEKTWLPYLGSTLDAGVAALFACEIIEACKYLIGPNPVEGIWLGAANDVIMRERGIEFVDGSAPGFAAIVGAAPDSATAVKIARELQQKNLYVFMAGRSHGISFAEQLTEAGVQLGWETRLVPFGSEVSAAIYALGFANRAAMSFGGVAPGDYATNLKYNKDRVFAFVLALGEVDDEKYAAAAGAINYGFPVIADTDIPEILPTGICTYEHVVANVPHAQIVERALEVRGCKITVDVVPIPVGYSPAFEGERIRKTDVHAEFGGQRTTCFEFLRQEDGDNVVDGRIQIIGKDLHEVPEGTALPLAIWVEVSGRKMQTDFEPILERQIHHLVNSAEGIWHMGQRNIVWTRVSKAAYAKGFRLRHYGDILVTKLKSEYPAIVDKVQVTLITDKAEVEKRLAVARKVFDERDRRLESMTDESVDTYYSCLLCQSFAPDHVCMITPERLGLCGAYNWLDGKAAFEIDPTGPNQPVLKGETLDPRLGVWKGVNDYVFTNSHKAIRSFAAYSLMEQPMTSCGCFEAIVAYVPECNGVMIVNREFAGETPVGMTFSTLAGSVGGGQQTPGFMGVGKVFLTSRKFLAAEGGFRRLVWMPKELKEQLRADLDKRAGEQGVPNLFDLVADETVASDPAGIMAHLKKVNHPVLAMEDLSQAASKAAAPVESAKPAAAPAAKTAEAKPAAAVTSVDLEQLKREILSQVTGDLTKAITEQVVRGIISNLSQNFLGAVPAVAGAAPTAAPVVPAQPKGPAAAERLAAIQAVPADRNPAGQAVWTVTLGATKAQGGTRSRAITIGGHRAMPFHNWQAPLANKPVVAMEVFDQVSDKYPALLRAIYGDLLKNPVAMARACVEKYGAEMISVRLDGTHPERGNLPADKAVALVKAILAEVGVPVIVTGHNHFEKNNEVMKAVAAACTGEALLLNWIEQNNYRTIAGAALAYGHSVVSQSPIDLNIGKQLNILLGNMSVDKSRIVMDPMTGAMGYGLEYTYSVMERIRLTALGGDAQLAGPMIVSPGQECIKTKEYRAEEKAFPTWGDLGKRAVLWETTTATSLLTAGADLLIMYHPEAAQAVRRTIAKLSA